jgi:hypothetical protein
MKRTMQEINYAGHPDLTPLGIPYAPRKESGAPAISDAPRRKPEKIFAQRTDCSTIHHAARDESLPAILNAPDRTWIGRSALLTRSWKAKGYAPGSLSHALLLSCPL